MRQPGFTADYSLYTGPERYRVLSVASALRDEGATVMPQSCPWYVWLGCGAKVSACGTICTASSGPAWLSCMGWCLTFSGASLCINCFTSS